MDATKPNISGIASPSLSSRIANARERAESFTSRNPPPQVDHKQRMDAIEKERSRWIQMYEEKSIIIEQLERELRSTVDALHKRDLNMSGMSVGSAAGGVERSRNLEQPRVVNTSTNIEKDDVGPKSSVDVLNFTDGNSSLPCLLRNYIL